MITEAMDEAMPAVRSFTSVIEDVSVQFRCNPRSTDFLKKMKAPEIIADATTCSIDQYINHRVVSRKNINHQHHHPGQRDKNNAQDWRCDDCNATLVYVKKDAQRVCLECGKSTFFQEMTRGDMILQGYTPTTTYLYQRLNHFKTWIKRTQGKETTTISPEITAMVRKELKKERITDMSKVDHIKIKAILKKLRKNRYYNHCVQITTMVTGKAPPQMTDRQEETLVQMFEKVQIAFEKKIKGKKRQNMLSYSFLIHKFLQILSLDEYLPYFPLLVSADKIQIQDSIWQELCIEVNFEFIKSTM
ncbi:FirrV-1-B20 [Feldmannia irregularis virus a]|uniref:FirrV-1-B20 n=1 Tax=Feldmannia irregularis virus a TaxID=231992 RepID=Q6XM16_9PHYC|nr:FirrV-1-B20 [Feldmannia irregularis virus a]AAR26895.1 FirrV-1-B20 [Feldmannia irregularis virus a]